MDAKDWRFPMPCPVCKAVSGNPFRVIARSQTVELGLKCGECRHHWSISAHSPSLIFVRKEDRRSVNNKQPV